ncbi:MAG: hypothetical protein HY392_04085 [Candidatus Diapherotrites archaeon]|nr:hypothetical protein [Candidatus Diapherotrites archaeon]
MASNPVGVILMIAGAGLAILNPGIFGSGADSLDFLAGVILIIIGFVLMAGTGTSSKSEKMEETNEKIGDKVFHHETKQQTEDITESMDEKDHVTRKIETQKTEKKTEIEEE